MRSFFVFFCVFALYCSCQEKPVNGKTPEKNYYLEFVNDDFKGEAWYIISRTKRAIIGNGYYYIAAPDDEKWIMSTGNLDSIDLSKVNENQRSVHRFKDFADYKPVDSSAEKIVITIHQPDKNGYRDFDFHSYQYRNDKWQSAYNPGNFRHHNALTESAENNYAAWMSDLIVRLTFK